MFTAILCIVLFFAIDPVADFLAPAFAAVDIVPQEAFP